jgi:hypothetical protein
MVRAAIEHSAKLEKVRALKSPNDTSKEIPGLSGSGASLGAAVGSGSGRGSELASLVGSSAWGAAGSSPWQATSIGRAVAIRIMKVKQRMRHPPCGDSDSGREAARLAERCKSGAIMALGEFSRVCGTSARNAPGKTKEENEGFSRGDLLLRQGHHLRNRKDLGGDDQYFLSYVRALTGHDGRGRVASAVLPRIPDSTK